MVTVLTSEMKLGPRGLRNSLKVTQLVLVTGTRPRSPHPKSHAFSFVLPHAGKYGVFPDSCIQVGD